MTNQVNLTADEIARIQSAVNTQAPNGVGMYADAYRMVVQIDNEHRAAGLPTLDAGTRNWFEKAIEINENDPTSTGNSFVRTVTVAGLTWDGKSVPSLQEISNNIGAAVIQDIARNGGISETSSMLQNDIKEALDKGGQTIGGWGGSFYYWDSAFTNPETGEQTTIGQYISNNPAEYEKFVAVNSFALSESLKLAGNLTAQDIADEAIGGNGARSIWDVLYGTSGAQVPLSIRSEILSRALGSAFSGTYAGNPDSIDGWTRNSISGKWEIPSINSEFPDAQPTEADDTTAARLDAIRAERINHQEQGQFSTPDLGPHASTDAEGNTVYQFVFLKARQRRISGLIRWDSYRKAVLPILMGR